jgi:hypothetical protein
MSTERTAMRSKCRTIVAAITKTVTSTISNTHRCLTRAVQQLRVFWRDHGEQLVRDPSYAAALATVVAVLVEVVSHSAQVSYLASRLTDAYIALHRVLRPRGRGYGEFGGAWS